MSAAVSLREGAHGRLGVMVRTETQLYVYWKPGAASGEPLRFRIHDVTGRPPAQSLDGTGAREVEATGACYVDGLIPGHLYYVEVGQWSGGAFHPLMGAGPVQTPWRSTADTAAFPAPYHRS